VVIVGKHAGDGMLEIEALSENERRHQFTGSPRGLRAHAG
jgi:hypothetical protein